MPRQIIPHPATPSPFAELEERVRRLESQVARLTDIVETLAEQVAADEQAASPRAE